MRIPSTSLSARIPFIAIPSPVYSCSLSDLFQEPGMASVELGLEVRGVSLGSPGENELESCCALLPHAPRCSEVPRPPSRELMRKNAAMAVGCHPQSRKSTMS